MIQRIKNLMPERIKLAIAQRKANIQQQNIEKIKGIMGVIRGVGQEGLGKPITNNTLDASFFKDFQSLKNNEEFNVNESAFQVPFLKMTRVQLKAINKFLTNDPKLDYDYHPLIQSLLYLQGALESLNHPIINSIIDYISSSPVRLKHLPPAKIGANIDDMIKFVAKHKPEDMDINAMSRRKRL